MAAAGFELTEELGLGLGEGDFFGALNDIDGSGGTPEDCWTDDAADLFMAEDDTDEGLFTELPVADVDGVFFESNDTEGSGGVAAVDLDAELTVAGGAGLWMPATTAGFLAICEGLGERLTG